MPKPTTLERPKQRLIDQFTPGQAKDDTICEYLTKGFSLVICCKRCPRMIEWTPPELDERFGDKLGLRIAQLAERLSCAGEGGCGSNEVAVFPHVYDGAWRWAPRSVDQ